MMVSNHLTVNAFILLTVMAEIIFFMAACVFCISSLHGLTLPFIAGEVKGLILRCLP
jgi:hypothetical protein